MENIYNTRKIQIAILCGFMKDKHDALYCGTGFLGDEGKYTPFKKAVKMYNDLSVDEKYSYGIEKLKLTYDKKAKKIVCTNHTIRLTQEVKADVGEEFFIKTLKTTQ